MRGTQYIIWQSGKGRGGKTDSEGRDYSFKQRALSFEVLLHLVQTVIQEVLSQKNNATRSTHTKSVKSIFLICREVKKFRTIICEVTEH